MIKHLLAFVMIISAFGLNAQLNPKHIYINGKVDTIVNFELRSTGPLAPEVVVYPTSFDSLGFDPLGSGVYAFTFGPSQGYLGDEQLTIRYYEPSNIPGFHLPNYTTVHYRVENSKLDCAADAFLADASASVELDVLANDATSDGNMTISRIAHVEGGTASISNNKILFTSDGSSHQAYVRYFVEDDTDNIEAAVLNISIENTTLTETRYHYTNDLSSIDLYLNASDYYVSTSPSNGTLTQTGHVWTYRANNAFNGLETIVFSHVNGGEITYNIEVLDKTDNRSFVNDDKYFVSTDGSLDFNVFDNDFLDDFPIIDHSPELTYNGDGSFSYTPPAGFTGDEVFYYKIYAAFQFHTGYITIHVDDYAPHEAYNYEFTILNNHDLVVNHDAPITEYSFSEVTAPSNGSLIILDETGTEVLDCETISGDNTIIYTPNLDYSGTDQFTLEYCTDSGICETVDITVNILSSNYTDCLCLSDCVYEGDANNDGVVDVRDVLSIALNIGEGGLTRDSDFDLFWTGQTGADWGYEQLGDLEDLKSSDCNGDGYIDVSDFQAVSDNYVSVHNFVPNNVGNLTNIPVSFVPQSTDVDSGEWIFIDIYAGNISNPALDFYGLSFSLNIDPEVMDSASVIFEAAEDNWLSQYTPLETLTIVPVDGKIDMALTRINNLSVSGIGLLGTLSFIIEDETEGFKENGFASYVARDISMTNILSVSADGEYRRHPDYVDHINVAVEEFSQDDINLAQHIELYPNPSSDILIIESDKYTIDRVQLFDAMGRLALDQNNTYFRSQLDISSLQEGVYFARVFAQGEVLTLKVQKIDR